MITATMRDGIMAGITEAGNIMDPAAVFVGLFTAIDDQSYNTVIGDVTEPTGDPGTRVAVTTWGVASIMADGRSVRNAPDVTFRPADDTEATVVLGWFLADALTAGNLLQFGFFDEPIPLPDETASVTVVARLTVDPLGRWDATATIDG